MKTSIFSLVLILFLLVSCGNKRPSTKEKNTATPLFLIDPAYPRKAAIAGVEGRVKIQFTLTKTGRVKEPVVTDSYPKGVFDSEAFCTLGLKLGLKKENLQNMKRYMFLNLNYLRPLHNPWSDKKL